MPLPGSARTAIAETMGIAMQAAALAHPNIALVKYWGKRDSALNLPAVGSISVTLDSLWTKTRITFDPSLPADAFTLNGNTDAAQAQRVTACLDLLRERADQRCPASIVSVNNFPTAAGLASSASGFAALVVAAAHALDLDLSTSELSAFARRGSGSAARSIIGGFAEMSRGTAADGSDAVACELLNKDQWPLDIAVGITDRAAKAVGSTVGMERSAETSPFYRSWVAHADEDLAEARRAILAHDFEGLAAVSEYSCLKMHAVALSTRPGLVYWNAATVECIHRVRELRRSGIPVFFTIDAGPQVKALSAPGYGRQVADALAGVRGVAQVLTSGLGAGAELIESS